MKIKKIFDSLFVLSKSERNGAIVLSVIILLTIIFRFLTPAIFHNERIVTIDYDQRITQLINMKDSLNKANYQNQNLSQQYSRNELFISDKKNEHNPISKKLISELFNFDPNLVSFEELIKLGFSSRAAQSLINYREKGGLIRKNEDLKKIYGVDSILYLKIQPFISLKIEKAGKKLIEINSADSATLTSMNGIGPVYAGRICKYRNYLGGFVSIEQLKEVYKFPEETYLAIKGSLILDENKVQKINVNFCNVKELNNHPYCSYEDARKIVNYRSQIGFIKSVDMLLKDSIIEMSVFKRFAPYLKVQ